MTEEQQRFGLNPAYLKFDAIHEPEDYKSVLRKRFSEFPEGKFLFNSLFVYQNLIADKNPCFMLSTEWYMVQLTAQYEPSKTSIFNVTAEKSMLPIHISVLPVGKNGIDPFCITVPKPKMNTNYDICKEIQEILACNKGELEAEYSNIKLYWKMRDKQNIRMKVTDFRIDFITLR